MTEIKGPGENEASMKKPPSLQELKAVGFKERKTSDGKRYLVFESAPMIPKHAPQSTGSDQTVLRSAKSDMLTREPYKPALTEAYFIDENEDLKLLTPSEREVLESRLAFPALFFPQGTRKSESEGPRRQKRLPITGHIPEKHKPVGVTKEALNIGGFQELSLDGKIYSWRMREGRLQILAENDKGLFMEVTDPGEFLRVKKILTPETPVDLEHPTKQALMKLGFEELKMGKDTYMIKAVDSLASYSEPLDIANSSLTAEGKGALSSRRSGHPRKGRYLEEAYILGADGLYNKVTEGKKQGQMESLRRRFQNRL